MKRICLFAISLFISVSSFAIDPYGAKADYGGTSDRELWFPLIFLLVFGALFIYGYISETLRDKHKKQK